MLSDVWFWHCGSQTKNIYSTEFRSAFIVEMTETAPRLYGRLRIIHVHKYSKIAKATGSSILKELSMSLGRILRSGTFMMHSCVSHSRSFSFKTPMMMMMMMMMMIIAKIDHVHGKGSRRARMWRVLCVWFQVYSYFESRGCDREGWNEANPKTWDSQTIWICSSYWCHTESY